MTVVPYDTISTTSYRESIFTKCCCCIPLRIGCLILGYLNLIFNSIHTLSVLTITAYIGFYTHWFDHFNTESPHVMEDQSTEIKRIESHLFIHVELLLLMDLFINVAWLIINVHCLVRLHKKHPGPIKLYIIRFALTRLILMFSVVLYMIITGNTYIQRVVYYCVDWGLAAYFIFVYYIYAKQLERKEIRNEEMEKVDNNAFVCPKKLKRKYWPFRC